MEIFLNSISLLFYFEFVFILSFCSSMRKVFDRHENNDLLLLYHLFIHRTNDKLYTSYLILQLHRQNFYQTLFGQQ